MTIRRNGTTKLWEVGWKDPAGVWGWLVFCECSTRMEAAVVLHFLNGGGQVATQIVNQLLIGGPE